MGAACPSTSRPPLGKKINDFREAWRPGASPRPLGLVDGITLVMERRWYTSRA